MAFVSEPLQLQGRKMMERVAQLEKRRECKLIRFYFARWWDCSGADELTYKANLSNQM